MEDKKLKEAYNHTAKNFLYERTKNEGEVGFWNREVEQPLMLKLVPKNLNNLSLLDVGCGPGIHIKEYQKRGAKCTGIDFSKEMVKLAKKRCPKSQFNIGNINKLNFKNNSFDIVTSSLVLDHLKNLSKPLEEIHRILKKGGLFIFSVPHPIGYMGRDPNKKEVSLDGNYFNKKKIYLNISGNRSDFVDYQRTFQDYVNTLISKGFELVEIVENKPNKKWKNKYKNLNEFYFKMPILCFFKWKKK